MTHPETGRMHPFLQLGANAVPFASAPSNTAYNPVQIRTAYGFNNITFASYTDGSKPLPGAGQTIAIVDAYDDPNISSDLAAFDSAYNLPAPPNLIRMNQRGQTSHLPRRDSTGGWEMEEALDVEWAHAIAPGANIILVEANSNSTSDLLAAVRAATNYSDPTGKVGPVSVVSMSWGGGEFSGETSYDSTFTTPSGHIPISFVVSSGDYGAPPSWPSASPNVLSVGGTTLGLGANNSWGSETGWSGSGGGPSSYESQPSYQAGVVGQSTTARTNPDVSYAADPNPGFSIYDSIAYYGTRYNWTSVGGTSASAPQWAALLAIADQGRALQGLAGLTTTPSQQQTQPVSNLAQSVLYSLFSTSGYGSTYFHDITSGNNGYDAGSGYDLVTGLGTPHADQVVAALISPPAPGSLSGPTSLTAVADGAGPITLSWGAVPGATEYHVYRRNPDGTWPTTPLLITSAAITSVQNTGVVPGTAYTYRVTARNSTGESDPSPEAVATAAPDTLFSDGFGTAGTLPNSNWTVAGAGGNWIAGSGVLSQTSTADGDPKKAVLNPAIATSTSEEIFSKVRIDSWQDGEYARAGVGLFTDPTTGRGFNVVVRDRDGGSRNTIQFFIDGVGWGNSYTLATPLGVGTWYDFRLMYEGGSLYANVWQDGSLEPPTWQYVQTQYVGTGQSGAPSLNGGSSGTYTGEAHSSATVSFASVTVTGG